jgi:predicted amidohydrolase
VRGPGLDAQYPGRSVFFDPEGIKLAAADDTETIIYADIAPDFVADSRNALNFYHYRRPDLYGAICEPVEGVER